MVSFKEFKEFCRENSIKIDIKGFDSDSGFESTVLYGDEIFMYEELGLEPEREYLTHSFYLDSKNEELVGSIIECKNQTILVVTDSNRLLAKETVY